MLVETVPESVILGNDSFSYSVVAGNTLLLSYFYPGVPQLLGSAKSHFDSLDMPSSVRMVDSMI